MMSRLSSVKKINNETAIMNPNANRPKALATVLDFSDS